MNKVRVALFNDRAAAETIRDRLVNAGIQAEIHDEIGLARLWFVTKTTTGARLEVPVSQEERSLQILGEWGPKPADLGSAIRCPECTSLRVDYPQFTRKAFFPNLAMGLIAELGLLDKQFYCESCHHIWAPRHAKPKRARTHMAPHYFMEGVSHPHPVTQPHSDNQPHA
jgi:hypothetical protein